MATAAWRETGLLQGDRAAHALETEDCILIPPVRMFDDEANWEFINEVAKGATANCILWRWCAPHDIFATLPDGMKQGGSQERRCLRSTHKARQEKRTSTYVKYVDTKVFTKRQSFFCIAQRKQSMGRSCGVNLFFFSFSRFEPDVWSCTARRRAVRPRPAAHSQYDS